MDKIAQLILILFLLLLLIVLIKMAYQIHASNFLCAPAKEYVELPRHEGKDVWLPSGAHGIHYVVDPNNKTILYNHGNAGNISYWKDIIEMILSAGANVFIYDYHGFGRSRGIPIIEDMIKDGMEAHEYLIKYGLKPEQIVLWGESLGGHIALSIARYKPVSCLILIATFSCAEDLVDKYKFGLLYKSLAKIEPLDNLRLIKFVTVPTLSVHSIEDDVIPYSLGKKLFDHCPVKCKLHLRIKGKHASPQISPEELHWILDFCQIPAKLDEAEKFLKKICDNNQKLCPFNLPKIGDESSDESESENE